MKPASWVIGEGRIEFGLLYCGDLATAPVSHRTALVAVCRARVFVIQLVWVYTTALRADCVCVCVCFSIVGGGSWMRETFY